MFLVDTKTINEFRKDALKHPHQMLTLFLNAKTVNLDDVNNALKEDEEIRHVIYWFDESWWGQPMSDDAKKIDDTLFQQICTDIRDLIQKCDRAWKPARNFVIIDGNSHFFNVMCSLCNQYEWVDIKINPVGKTKLDDIQRDDDRFKCFRSRVKKIIDAHHSTNKTLQHNSPNKVYRY